MATVQEDLPAVAVEPDAVEISDDAFFTHNRLGLRLETNDGQVHVFALHRGAQKNLYTLLRGSLER